MVVAGGGRSSVTGMADDLEAMWSDWLRVLDRRLVERRGGTVRAWHLGGRREGVRVGTPFSKADLRRFGDETPPDGPILAIRVEDLAEKEAVLAARAADGFFTIPHFDNYAAVLIELDKVPEPALREALVDGWLVFAPPQLAKAHLDGE